MNTENKTENKTENNTKLNNPFTMHPTSSGYGWLETEPLIYESEAEGQMLVRDESRTCAAIIDEDSDGILTVNGIVINWHSSYQHLKEMLEEARLHHWVHYRPEPISNPYLAPGQKESNWVNTLTCGHEVDTEFRLPHGTEVHCSQHGIQKVTGPENKPQHTTYCYINGHYANDDGSCATCINKPFTVRVEADANADGNHAPELGRFHTEAEAAKFISTLPNADTGRYGIDGPQE